MSESQKTPITAVPDAETPEVVKKENVAKRAVNYVKNHKKAAIAVAGAVVLVVVSASLGNASSHDDTETSTDEDPELEALEADTVTN